MPLAALAEPAVLNPRPATLFAARFVGAGSFLDGHGRIRLRDKATPEIGVMIGIGLPAMAGIAYTRPMPGTINPVEDLAGEPMYGPSSNGH